ncbi:hypothetical protein ACFWWT_07405 [Streptomyces sp. NPDC058676]|uniref:hypothetical protein n=1 Tax=unclassified Streptomyces TaxID=2593676 RepID=UPI003656EBBA
MDAEEDERLAAITPEISRLSIDLLRRAAGTYPAERLAKEALEYADEIFDQYGTDGLRLLVMSLTGWAAVQLEVNAHESGRSLQSLLDDMMLTWLETETETETEPRPGADDEDEDEDEAK